MRSRLSRRLVQKTEKNLALSILGIIIIIFLAFKFGVPLLVNLSLFLSGSKNTQTQPITQDNSFIASPVLDSFPEATASADIIITGISSKNQTINLYLNDNLTDSAKTQDDGKFKFKETLKPGENTIKATVDVNGKESEFSNVLTVAFKSAPPSLNLDSPSDGQSFSKDQNTATVKGVTDPDVKVTVNGFWAITDSQGNFSYDLPLQSGDNKIAVIATDMAGNKSEKDIKVTYSP